MADINRDFKGIWIPRAVWLDTRLNALEKIILAEIDSLDNGERGCWASNKHLAAFCQCSERKVTEAISKLQELGYVYIQSFDGRNREIRSSLQTCEAASQNLRGRPAESAEQTSKDCEADPQNLRQRNTVINTEINTNRNSMSDKPTRTHFVKPTLEEITAYCKERGNKVDPERFLAYYESNGWKVGKNPMKDWRAAVRNWERNSFSTTQKRGTGANWDDLDGIL